VVKVSPEEGRPPAGPPLVVIVDPDHDFRAILGALFEHKGFASASTADPEEALLWVRSRRPAALIGEHPLVLSDGRILCAVLLEDPVTAAIPFVAVTAVAFHDDLQAARETHPHGVFAKPIEPHRIFEHIHALLNP
jgi:two-component system, cell cycle response regulator DivK